MSRDIPLTSGHEPITVVVCTFRGTEYLRAQLESIRAQSVPPAEVIVSDDASHDGTVELAREVLGAEGSDPIPHRIIVNDPGLGTAENFRRAVLGARTDLVALSDQDDVWLPDRLERALERHAADPDLELLFGDARLVDAAGTDLGLGLFETLAISAAERTLILEGRGFDVLLRRNLATGATVTLRRRLVEWAGPVGTDWLHDEWWAILAASRGRIGFTTAALINYRQHGKNQVGVTKASLRTKISRVLEADPDRNPRLARRTRALVQRLDEVDPHTLVAPDAVLADARAKLRIETFRAELPTNRLRRVLPVLRESRRGDYERYTSQGRAEIMRDLLQPR
ncbi:glycosyltransferase family 2 protein [Mycetocola sp. JXN-3]|uniref:glycosyltransferase family 2 protein n=1 Tax=Mycetocola sp. JXN-3 TaxID=2116510 RepID=UPI00165D1F3A|nr:glycosyltransferase family 2 protein [Mycetocola sp. JXN-3]